VSFNGEDSARGSIGCGAPKFHGRWPIEINRMWVTQSARGLGIGRRILSELEAEGHRRGAVVRLETNKSLTEAIDMYRAPGTRRSRPSTTSPTRIPGSRRASPQRADDVAFDEASCRTRPGGAAARSARAVARSV
jgi:hypothetical protein